MSANRYLLDTSAILAYMEGEEGARRVEAILYEEASLISWPTLLEVIYISRRERGEAVADSRYALIRESPATILWDVTEPVLLTAARFKAEHGLSFADAIIAAYAFRHKAILLHKDAEFEQLSGVVQLESLPYK